MTTSRHPAAAPIGLLLLAGLLLAGCSGLGGRQTKEATSGLWIEPSELPLADAAMLDTLAAAGIREVFVPVAELDLGADGGPLKRRPLPELAPSLRLNVVVEGELELAGREAAAAAASVGGALRQLLFDVEARGIVPVGVHFDLREIDAIAAAGKFFRELRGALGETFLSLSLRRSWMDSPEIRELTRGVDYAVPFLYGQRAWEQDSDAAWDFEVLKGRLAQLEDDGVPYMLGIIGVGTATHKGRDGAVKAYTSRQALAPFLWNRDLKLQSGFTLEATYRRAYTLVAERPTRVGDWKIAPRDEIRLVRPMTTDLEQLLALLARGDYRHLIGQLYYRLPAPEERMSLTVENVLNALDAGPQAPDLRFEVQVTRRTRRGHVFRFVVANQNGETTELSLLDNNYLQITADEDAFGAVDVGDFYQYDLLRLKPGGEVERRYRNANVVRLRMPILEGRQRIVSGDVEIHRRNPTLTLNARFMLPDGRTVELGPYTWKDGELHGLEKDEGEAPAADAPPST